MEILTCLCISSFFGIAGVAVGIALMRWFDGVGEEIDYLRKKEEELKELETRVESKARREPDELSLLLMKEQRLAYEAEEERAKKRAAGAGVKSHDESFRENVGILQQLLQGVPCGVLPFDWVADV